MEKNEKNTSMKLRFLGTAAATSMPLVFCNCEICKQARINKGKDFRKRASAIINNEMLIDFSPDLCSMANLYDIDLGKIKYLLQTIVTILMGDILLLVGVNMLLKILLI